MAAKGEVLRRLTKPPVQPPVTAKFLCWLVTEDVAHTEFATTCWDIYDVEVQRRWVTPDIEAPQFPFDD
jgi:hypothetical protein